MPTWNKDQKVCATCAFWAGKREVDLSGEVFTALEAEGKCEGPGDFNASSMGEGGYCSAWEIFFI